MSLKLGVPNISRHLQETAPLGETTAVIGKDYPIITNWFNNEGQEYNITVPTDGKINFNTAGLDNTGADNITSQEAASRILNLLIKDYDISTNLNHRRAQEFLNIIILSTIHDEEPVLVLWDDKNNYIILDFSKRIYMGERYASLLELRDETTYRAPDAQFNPVLLQAFGVSPVMLRLLRTVIGEENLNHSFEDEFVELPINLED